MTLAVFVMRYQLAAKTLESFSKGRAHVAITENPHRGTVNFPSCVALSIPESLFDLFMRQCHLVGVR